MVSRDLPPFFFNGIALKWSGMREWQSFHTHQHSYLAWSHTIIKLSLRFLLVLTFAGGFLCAKHCCQLLSRVNSFVPHNNDIDRWPHYPPPFFFYRNRGTEKSRALKIIQPPSERAIFQILSLTSEAVLLSSKWDSAPGITEPDTHICEKMPAQSSPPPQQSLLTPSSNKRVPTGRTYEEEKIDFVISVKRPPDPCRLKGNL